MEEQTSSSDDLVNLSHPIDLRQVDEEPFLFYLASYVPLSVDELARECKQQESDVEQILNERFQREINTDQTGFIRPSDAARNPVVSQGKQFIEQAKIAKDEADTLKNDHQLNSASVKYRHAVRLLVAVRDGFKSVNYVSEQLNESISNLRNKCDETRKQYAKETYKHRTILANKYEERGDEAFNSEDFETAEVAFERAKSVLEEALEEIETYNNRRLASDSPKLRTNMLKELVTTLEKKYTRAKKRIARAPSGDTRASRSTDEPEKATTQQASDTSSGNPTKGDLVNAIDYLTKKLDRAPTATEMKEQGPFDPHQYYNTFGKWTDALEQAELDVKSDLVSDLRSVAEELDQRPTQADVDEHGRYASHRYTDYFETWQDALRAADIEAPTDEDLIDEIHRLEREHGKIPSSNLMRDQGKYSAHRVRERFGSWDDALKAAGIDKHQRLIKELQRIDSECKGQPTTTMADNISIYSSTYFANEFGSWSEALEEAGISTDEKSGDSSGTTSEDTPEENEGPTAEELIEELQQLDQQLDHIPSEATIKNRSVFSPEDYCNRFGDWDHALTAAGLSDESDSTAGSNSAETDSEDANAPTDKQLLDEIHRLDREYARVPLTTRMREEGRYSPHQYYNRFGSWDESLKAAGINRRKRLIQELNQVDEKCDGRLTTTVFNDYSEYNSAYLIQIFGSWDETLEAAGIAGNSNSDDQLEQTDADASGDDDSPTAVSEEDGIKPSDEELLDEVRRLDRKLAETPTGLTMMANGNYKPVVYIQRFGGWDEALEAAGITSKSDPDLTSTPADSAVGEEVNTERIRPNELAELYESLRLLNKVLIEYIEATSNIDLGDDAPVAKWQSVIEDVAVGNGISADVPCLGKLHADRNPFSMSEYREQYGNKEWVTDFQALDMAEVGAEERSELLQVAEASRPEVQRPIVPGSSKPLPVLLSNGTDLSEALILLEELLTSTLDLDTVAPPAVSDSNSKPATATSPQSTSSGQPTLDPDPTPLTLADIDTNKIHDDPIAGRLTGYIANPSGKAALELHLTDIDDDDFWLLIFDQDADYDWKKGNWYFISQFRGPEELGGGRGDQALRSTPQLAIEDHGATLPPTIDADLPSQPGTKERGSKATDKNESERGSAQSINVGDEGSETNGQELLDELHRIDNDRDRIPYPSDIHERNEFTVSTYRERFGSWDDALAAAGIDKETRLLEEIDRLRKDLQQVPTTVDMNNHGKYSAGIYNRYFGSWTAAKQQYREWQGRENNIPTIDGNQIETSNDDNQNTKLSAKRLKKRLFSKED